METQACDSPGENTIWCDLSKKSLPSSAVPSAKTNGIAISLLNGIDTVTHTLAVLACSSVTTGHLTRCAIISTIERWKICRYSVDNSIT